MAEVEDEATSHRVVIAVVATREAEDRSPFVAVHRATLVEASREVDLRQSRLAFTCKSKLEATATMLYNGGY